MLHRRILLRWPDPETVAWMREQRMRTYLMRELVERGVGADVVEVAPLYDQPMDITALLANRVILELTTGMAQRRSR